jgi:tetratricopeptide (TPR) repeat protein
MGDKMDYHVAADTAAGDMARDWMSAAGERGIPSAFIVGKDGRIAWIGHPMGKLEATLAKVIDGTFDVQAASEAREKERAAAEREQELFKPITALRREGKHQEALEVLDKVLADHPEFKSRFAYLRYTLLLDSDESEAYRFAKELSEGQYKDNANMLAALSRAITDRNTKLKSPDYDTALALAQKASGLSKNKNPDHIAAVAEVQYRTRQYGKAIETMQQAIALVTGKKDALEGAAKSYQARLERFQKMKEKREGAASDPKPAAGEEKK